MTATGARPIRFGDDRRRRRHRILTRVVPVVAIAIAALVVGLVVAGGAGRAERATVRQYVVAWEHGRYGEMYSLLDSGSRRALSQRGFVSELQSAAATATLQSLHVLSVGGRAG